MSSTPPQSLFISSQSENFIKPHFVENIGNKYNCVSCNDYLRQPIKQLPCGHRICEKCVGEVRQAGTNTRCPGKDDECVHTDLTNPDHVLPDFGVVREMKGTKVYCTNKDYGCQEVMTWLQLNSHIENCKYMPVDCPNRDLGCPKRSTHEEMDRHSSECEYQPQVCTFCGCRVPMKEMKEGHENRCASRPKPCDFQAQGCSFTAMKKEELVQHLEQDHYMHIKVLVEAYQNLKIDNQKLKAEVTQLQGKNNTLEKDMNEAKKKADDLSKNQSQKMKQVMKLTGTNSEKVSILEGSHDKLQEVSKIHESRINELETNRLSHVSQSVPKDMERQLNNMDRTIHTYNVRLAENDLRMQCLETASYNGVLIWKITDYTRRKKEAQEGRTLSLYSQPFYSSRFGYKMCCRVYLNGDGMGKGQHLSVFFVIMRGDYDDLLPWPFRQKVTLTLLDVKHGRQNLTDTFRPDPTSNSFKKPAAEMNVASGCPLFATQSSVESSTYLKNDTIYLKVSIDTADLNMP